MTKAEKFVLKRRLRDCYSTDKSRVYEIAEREIDRIPTTEDRPKGEWIKNAPENQFIDPPYICSECGRAELRKENFCCSCGADMRGEK